MDYEQHISKLAGEGQENLRKSLKNPETGLEAENLHLNNGNNYLKSYSAAINDSFKSTLEKLGKLKNTTIKRDSEGNPKNVKFSAPIKKEGDWVPEFTYDYGPQGEIGTQPLSNLDELAQQKREIERLAELHSPEDTSFYQIGLSPNLMLRDEEFDDIIDWEVDEDTETDIFRNPCLRYGNIEDTYGKPSIVMGGAGGLQVSGVPRISGNIDKINIDDIATGFMGGIGELPGIAALNPLFYSLTDSGAIISEEDIQKHHGRTETYKHRHERSDIIPEKIGREKHGYLPKFAENDTIEETVRQNSEELLEYTAPVPLKAVNPETEDSTSLHEKYGYDLDDEFSIVLIDDEFESIEGSSRPVTHRDIVENGYIEGYMRLEDQDGEEHREKVSLDLDDLEEPDEFLKRNYLQAESMNKPNIRLRLDYGCFENRDQDNTPEWQAALGIQESKMRNWLKFQRAAYDEGFRNEHADYLRDQHERKGLEAELHPDTDTTIIDFLGEYRELFTDAIDPVEEQETYEATSNYINSILEGGPTPAEEASQNYEGFMEKAKVR